MVNQLLPIGHTPMLKYELKGHVFKEEKLGRMEDGGQPFLLVFFHGFSRREQHCSAATPAWLALHRDYTH